MNPGFVCEWCEEEFSSWRGFRAHTRHCEGRFGRARRRRRDGWDQERDEAERLEEGFEMLDEDYGS